MFSLASEFDTIREIKEKHCYVANDFKAEMTGNWVNMKEYEETNKNNCVYHLPDGETITLGNQRFRCPEILFNPAEYGF